MFCESYRINLFFLKKIRNINKVRYVRNNLRQTWFYLKKRDSDSMMECQTLTWNAKTLK